MHLRGKQNSESNEIKYLLLVLIFESGRKNQSFSVEKFITEGSNITTSVENARALERAVS